MIEILPSINCPRGEFDLVHEKVGRVEHFANFVHVDVADGRFTHGKSWDEPERWAQLKTLTALEVHLMVEEPERHLARWLAAGAKRIIVHYEAVCRPEHRVLSANPDELFARMIRECEEAGAELVLAINAETPIAAIGNYLQLFSSYLVMCQAYPGPSGQPFLPLMLDKISMLREKFPEARIEADGGITGETARLAVRAGADALVVGTYLFGADRPEELYQELRGLG